MGDVEGILGDQRRFLGVGRYYYLVRGGLHGFERTLNGCEAHTRDGVVDEFERCGGFFKYVLLYFLILVLWIFCGSQCGWIFSGSNHHNGSILSVRQTQEKKTPASQKSRYFLPLPKTHLFCSPIRASFRQLQAKQHRGLGVLLA